MRHLVALAFAVLAAMPGRTGEAREFGRAAAPEIVASGRLDYILPRFPLKTGRRAYLVESGADARFGPGNEAGQAVTARGGATCMLSLDTDNPAARLVADWLGSDICLAALRAHRPEDGPPFDPAHPPPIVPVILTVEEVEATQAHVAGLKAADPGGEIVNR